MAISYNTSVVRDGLVLYLDAANPKSYPGTGTTFFNLKINNNSTIINGVAFNTLENGYFSFDGIDDYISVGNIDLRNTSYSICSWVKPEAFDRLNPIVGDLQFNWFGLYFNNTVLVARHRRQSDNFNNEITYNFTDTTSKWYFITMVFDILNGMRLYVNGVLVTSNSSTQEFQLAPPRGLQYIGRHSLGVPETQNYFLGNIAYFTTYTKALTQSEIEKNFEATRGRYGI
jgi:hypothetical protein